MRTCLPATPRALTTTSFPEDAPKVKASPLTRCISAPPDFFRTSRLNIKFGPTRFFTDFQNQSICLDFVAATSNLYPDPVKSKLDCVSRSYRNRKVRHNPYSATRGGKSQNRDRPGCAQPSEARSRAIGRRTHKILWKSGPCFVKLTNTDAQTQAGRDTWLQVLLREGGSGLSRLGDGGRRAQRLRQVQYLRRRRLGVGRAERQDPARRAHGRCDLQWIGPAAPARHGRGDPDADLDWQRQRQRQRRRKRPRRRGIAGSPHRPACVPRGTRRVFLERQAGPSERH